LGVGSILDDQNGAPAALHDSARRLEAVLNNATVAIFLMDDRKHCVYSASAPSVAGAATARFRTLFSSMRGGVAAFFRRVAR